MEYARVGGAENSGCIYSMREKQWMKEYCKQIVPDEIISRRKMGFTSDVAIWFQKNGVFYDLSQKLSQESYQLPYGKRLAKDVSALLELRAEADYNPNSRSKGTCALNQLYVKMLVLCWLKGMEHGEPFF